MSADSAVLAAIHPTLRQQAEREKARRDSDKGEAAKAISGSEAAAAAAAGGGVVSIVSPSSTAAGASKRESLFRHSFVEIEHPLAMPTTRSRHAGMSIAEEDEAAYHEAATRAAALSPEGSLSHIIKQALLQKQNESDAADAHSKTRGPSASPPIGLAASVPIPASPSHHQPQSPATTATSPQSTPREVPVTTISMSRLVKLLSWFVHQYSKAPSTYRTAAKSYDIQQRATALARLDYHITVIPNDNTVRSASTNSSHTLSSHSNEANFEYCSSYPLDLIIFENERTGPYGVESTSVQSRVNDAEVLKPLFRLSRFSRVHGRFVMPVILVHNKNICRSSTLAIQAEAMMNNLAVGAKQVISSFWGTLSGFSGVGASASIAAAAAATGSPNASNGVQQLPSPSSSQSSVVQVGLEGQRGHDLQLLLHTATSYIDDLMVEQQKRKLGVALTSSEKNERWRYSQMKLNALPYPGCEFFTEYSNNNHSGLNLYFNWSQSFISSDLLLSSPSPYIPDEMLSCNGRLAVRRGAHPIEEDTAPWFEFEHDGHHHYQERERRRQAQETATAPALPDPLSVVSPPPLVGADSSVSPPVVSTAAEEILDQLLSHSSSSLTSESMASTVPKDDTLAVGATSSSVSADVAVPVATITSAITASPDVSTVIPAVSSFSAASSAASSSTSAAAASTGAVAAAAGTPVAPVAPVAQPTAITSFSLYKSWDVVTLTKNYLLVLLAHVADEAPNTGVLIHCISGWDRTPLFISLMRLSLWADGEVHRSLNAMQILYFTIAYDWCLFGHLLANRLEKREDVFYFCFDFLQYITHSKFSLQTAVAMRARRRHVEEALNIERSATPTPAPSTAAPAPPVPSATTTQPSPSPAPPAKPAKPVSALSVALKRSASDGAPTRIEPPDVAPHSANHAAHYDDEAQLLIGPSSFSPSTSTLLPMPPVSSSFVAAKPIPSLESFIIESHSSDLQQHSNGSATAPTSSASPLDLPAYVPPANSIPIPQRRNSRQASPHPSEESIVVTSLASSATPLIETPIPVPVDPRLFTPSSTVTVLTDATPPGTSQASSSAGPTTAASVHRLSRINSWTTVGLTTPFTATPPQTLASVASPADSTPAVDRSPPTAPAGCTPSAPPPNSLRVPSAADVSASPSTASPPPPAAYPVLTAAESTLASVRRCERLLEVRALFLAAYHQILDTPPAAPSPHACFTPFSGGLAEATNSAKQRTRRAASRAAAQPTPRNNAATTAAGLAAAPIAAPVATPAVVASNGWFS